MASISKKSYEILKYTHIKDYHSLFNRVSLNLGGETHLFQQMNY